MSSILSCVKKGGGIDSKKAIEYFNSLDRNEEMMPLRRSRSSSILDLMSSSTGTIDVAWFLTQVDAMDAADRERSAHFSDDERGSDLQPKVKKARSARTPLLEVLQDDGTRCKASPYDTSWYQMYVSHPMLSVKKFHRKFRQRFRLPYDQFLQFVAEAREENWFPRWGKWNNTSSLELLILGSFRYLGRG
jgi:hypothetical protein